MTAKMTTEYQPLLLSTVESLNEYWPYINPLLQRSVDNTAQGLMETSDIYQLAVSGKAFIMVFTSPTPDGPDVALVLAMAPAIYPRGQGISIFAVGGNNLRLLYKKYWPMLCGWAYMNGARFIEAEVSPAMKRIVDKMGFRQTHIQVRYDLSEQ